MLVAVRWRAPIRTWQRALAWSILIIASVTAARFMQVLVEESSASAVTELNPRRAQIGLASNPADSVRVVVLVSVVDAGGNRQHLYCRTTPDRVSTGALLLNTQDAAEVLPELCDALWT